MAILLVFPHFAVTNLLGGAEGTKAGMVVGADLRTEFLWFFDSYTSERCENSHVDKCFESFANRL